MLENKMSWLKRNLRMDETDAVITVKNMYVEGKMGRRLPKKWWFEVLE